jgi:hypothetical protein
MEKQYIFFNSAKALLVLFIGQIALFVLAGFLASEGISNIHIAGVIFLPCAGLLTWLCFWLDRK